MTMATKTTLQLGIEVSGNVIIGGVIPVHHVDKERIVACRKFVTGKRNRTWLPLT